MNKGKVKRIISDSEKYGKEARENIGGNLVGSDKVLEAKTLTRVG